MIKISTTNACLCITNDNDILQGMNQLKPNKSFVQVIMKANYFIGNKIFVVPW